MRLLIIFVFLFPYLVFSQDYNIDDVDGQTIFVCDGNFYDAGGPDQSYEGTSNYTVTICPENGPTQQLSLEFVDFTVIGYAGSDDYLIIYNGDSTDAEEFGVYTDTSSSTQDPNNGNPIVANNSTGCLTIVFNSAPPIAGPGWHAIISCEEPCQEVTAEINSSPSANDDGSIEVDLDEPIDFSAIGTFSNGISDDAIYEWNLGDGTILYGENIQHSFSSAGLYNVTLTITDYNDCTSNIAEVQVIAGATTPGNPYVSAGDDINLDCPQVIELSAEFLDIGETDIYVVNEIAFVPPFQFQGLSNSLNTNIDDAWDSPQNLPFDFCFFGNLEQQFQVGSNGLIRFDIDASDTYNDYVLQNNSTYDIPTNGPEAISEGNIFTPVHDIYPSTQWSDEEIAWEIIGEYPNRVLAVSFYNVPMFSCTNLKATHMAVLYETTNVIDIYILEKNACTQFNQGAAALGIQNHQGTEGYVPPQRNSSDTPWSTQEEAWRFTPAGDSIIEFEWLDSNGELVSTNPNFEVLPTETTSYTARVTYTTCTGNPIVVEDEIIITVDEPPFDVESVVEIEENDTVVTIEGDNIELCSDVLPITVNSLYQSETATYEWYLDGQILGENNSFITVSTAETGIYTVEVFDEDCLVTDDIRINFGDPNDSSFELTATCDGATATVTGLPGGSFAFADVPTDGAVIDSDTGTITGGSYGSTYNIEYTTNDACPSTSTLEVTTLDEDDSSFELTATCDGATATVTGLPGGSFAFADAPADGAVIDSDTGTITGGLNNTEYSINYTTNSECPTTTTISVISLSGEDSSFELTATCDGATATVTGLPGGSFAFADVPTDGAVIDSDTGTITGGDYGSEYQINYTTNGSCSTTTTETVTVNNPPEIVNPTSLEVCDDNIADGLTQIDLTIKNSEITNGNPNYSVSYYFSETNALNGENPLPINYTNISNPQTVHIRVEDINTNCFATTTLDLNVITAPSATAPPALEYCDADADGFGVFNLSQLNEAISDGQVGLTITYHETQADAENNVNAIVGDYNNINPYIQTIYIRVESSTVVTDCATYLDVLLIVNDVPQINTESSSLEVCDDDTDGFGLFDLSLSNEEVLNGLDPSDFDITYYENAENAENAENPIITPFAYTNVSAFNQTVWVRVENNTTLCYNTSSIELIVNELPVLTQPDPLNLCDYNNPGDEVEEFTLEDSIGQVLQGQTGIGITFYETQEDADNATNPIVSPYTNTSNAQTIYLRGENEITGCYSTITLDLRVNPIPSPVVPDPIEECDEDNDGFTFFTVEDNEVDIINGELDIVLSYYETTTNAENAIDPIISPYYNIVPDSQIIFVRAENIVTGCFTIVEQELVTIPSPELPIIIEDIVVCDDDYDGITVFDLTQRDEDIFGEQSTTDFGLTYHETLIDAETGENPIVNTTSYENLTNPQTIFVRLEDLNNGCVSIGEFNLIVALPPVIVQPTALEECDDEIADETTEFDLTVKNDEITAGNLDWEVIYYETEEDALAGTNAIETPEAYTNTAVAGNAANPQTLHVAVVNIEGCIAYTTLTIRVLPNPTPSTDAQDIGLCDYDNPGDQIEVFDITINEAYIINGEPGVSAAYYESLENATDEIDPIADPTAYTNIELGQQTIYVRVTNDTTGCFTIVTFDIIVNPLPDIGDVPDVIACEVNTDGFYDFDLEAVTAELLNPQDPVNFTVTYHETQEDADNGENALVSPYTNLTNPQQLFVNITNNLTGCNITGAGFNIVVQEAAIANGDGVPAELIICDDPNTANDGFAEFNLTNLDAQILDGQDPVNFTVTYYATIEDAEAFTNALPVNFENTSNPQTIFARVDNDTTVDDQCYDITDATLLVNLLPEFTLEDSYMACVDVNGTELIGPTVMLIDLPDNQYTFEWINPAGDLEAITAAHTPLMGGIYTAVATDILTGCRREVTTEVIPSSPAIEVSPIVTTEFFAEEAIIEVGVQGYGDYEYRLDNGPWQTENIFSDASAGFHEVTVRDLNGCGISTATVLVIDYPRFFTPNGDGYNDTWRVEGLETRPLASIYIFDRYGKLLKQLSPFSEGWDGTFNGKPLPATDYWFSITLDVIFGTEESNVKTFTGHFSLKR